MTNSPTNSIPNTTSRVNHFTGLARRRRKFSLLPANGDGSTLTLDFTTGVLDPRLTFTRGGDATFINSSGLVQYADANYFARSETFDGSPWSLNGVSQTAAAVTNPVGGNSSRLIEVTASGGSKSLIAGMAVSAGFQYTFRIWVRAGASSSVSIGYYSGTAFLNITMTKVSGPGTVSGGTGSAPQLITGLTSDWTQLQIVMATLATAVSGSWFIYPNGTSNAVGNSVYLWGAQANIGATANPYYSTTTAAYFAPRFDHDPTTLAPRGLLIEGSATNLLPNSQTLSGTGWFTGGICTRTSNYATGPDGIANSATRLEMSFSGGVGRTYYDSGYTTLPQTMSVWLKSNTGSNQTVNLWNTSGTPVSCTVTPTWKRFQSVSTTGSSLPGYFYFENPSTTVAVDILAWGAQLEAGSGASSYIPTGASTATRNEDSATMAITAAQLGFDLYRYTMRVRGRQNKFAAASSFARSLRLHDASTEQIGLAVSNNTLYGTSRNTSNNAIAEVSVAATLNQDFRFAWALDADLATNTMLGSFNQSPLSASRSATGPMGSTTTLSFNTNTSPTSNFASMTIRDVKFWPRQMTASELNALTAP